MANRVSGFINIENIQLEYLSLELDSVDTDPTIVFLHEGLGCVELWRDFPEKLCVALGLRGFVYSRQGYGASDPIHLPRPLDFMHQEALNVVPRVLDQAEIKSAILVGHSDGGSISLINAGAIRDPRIKALATIAAHVFNEEITVKSIEEAKNAFEKQNLRERLEKYHGNNVDCAFWGWNATWLHPDFRNWNLEEFLPNIDVPTLIIQGAEDQYGTIKQVKAIESGITCSTQTAIIEDAKHSPHLDQQDTTINEIKNFLNQHLFLD